MYLLLYRISTGSTVVEEVFFDLSEVEEELSGSEECLEMRVFDDKIELTAVQEDFEIYEDWLEVTYWQELEDDNL